MSGKYTDKKTMLEGSLWNKILGFAFPLALTGILQQLFNAADIAVVGNFAGDMGQVAMAAVGANTPLIAFVVNSFLGISLGTNVIVANAVGRKDDETVQKAVHTSMIVAVVGGVAVAILAQIFAGPILRSQNISEEAVDLAILYFRIYMGGLPRIRQYKDTFCGAHYLGHGQRALEYVFRNNPGPHGRRCRCGNSYLKSFQQHHFAALLKAY